MSGENVLIIDDDQSLGKTLLGILRKEGYNVEWAGTGQEGLTRIRGAAADQPWGAILIDIRLPDMNGLDLLRSAKKDDPDIGAIFMTGYTDVETAVGALNEGAFAYIQKPYNVSEVKAIIAKLVEKQRLIRENRMLLHKMVELNADLENRVAQRTKDLQTANLNLAATIEKLREADEAKSEFVSMVSHELRTPLTVIIGFAQTCMNQLEKIEKETIHHYMNIIYAHGLMLSKLIGNILDLSHIRDKGMILTFEKFDLRGLAATAAEGLKILKPSINFDVDFEDAAREMVSDKDRVQQIFMNLLGNAVKYTPEKGSISVQGRAQGADIVVSVIDSGSGIPVDMQEKIFEPFFRIKDPVNMKTSGTGLGLTITKALVEALGGRMSLESNPGAGSRFTFVLPKGKS